jgi:hypothetical protein
MKTAFQKIESSSPVNPPQPSEGGGAGPCRGGLDEPNFLLVYEDLQTGLRAKEIMDQMAGHLGCGSHVQPRLFRFDLMRLPGFLDWTVKERESTHFLVLSAKSGRLPDEVNAWLTLWLRQNDDRRRVLVIAFAAATTQRSEAAATLGFLCSLAEMAGAQVFAHLAGTPVQPTALTIRQWKEMMPAVPHEAALRAAPHWRHTLTAESIW